ncbi:hypothetical protein H2198_000325 [Neophaeococcomyces mojaviensis]|uniref:Uncharacterized protein n=1 Tax=Neophaeococcomyces mojaviensis TaxID=3383035 RepID=A0ACC3AKM8_9EURO|nr:hypothetical protein H2198_000325 [Knufia sp. JES_112]
MSTDQIQHSGTNSVASVTLPQASQVQSGHRYGVTSLDGNSTAHLGDVYHQYFHDNAARAQSQTTPRSSSLIPFRRDRDFVERDILQDICQRTTEPAARIGLTGLGGVGKAQIAIEYAYRRREADPQLWVFWVHASSEVRFEESYQQIAQQVNISSWADPKADVLSMVYAWLSDETHGRWTMVVDNADSVEVLFGLRSGETKISAMSDVHSTTTASDHRSLSNYLPSCNHGSIVITSRSREVTEGLIEYTEDILEVEPMVEEDATALLTKKLARQQRDVDADQLIRLVQELDYMPLAITQATAYINQLGSRMTVAGYIDRLAKGDWDRDNLLRKDIRDPRRDGRASNSIIITWHTSFEHIRRTQGSAAQLLALMSLFDREGIPQSLLQGQYNFQEDEVERLSQEPKMTNTHDQYEFEDDLKILRAYSLISIGTNDQLFDMHRLVQFTTKKWLELHHELERWQTRYARILSNAFPTGDHANRLTYQALFPHVEALISYRVESEGFLRDRATATYRGAWYAWASGKYGTAEKMARASMEDRGRLLSADHVETLESMGLLALVLCDQGKYEQAEEMSRWALAGREKELGVNHPDTLTSVSNLAVVLRARGKYEQAEEMNRQALAGYEKELGVNHPNTLTSVSNLALVLKDQGKYEQAEEMSRRSLTGYEKELGVNHPDTLTSVNNLALVLRGQGKYEQAEEMNRRALAGSEKELGVNHPNTLTSVSNLALVLRGQGKYEQAEEMNRRALTGREKELGVNHPNTLMSVYCLAELLHAQRDYREALRLYDRAVEGYLQVLGSSHPTTLACQRHRQLLLQDMNLP